MYGDRRRKFRNKLRFKILIFRDLNLNRIDIFVFFFFWKDTNIRSPIWCLVQFGIMERNLTTESQCRKDGTHT